MKTSDKIRAKIEEMRNLRDMTKTDEDDRRYTNIITGLDIALYIVLKEEK